MLVSTAHSQVDLLAAQPTNILVNMLVRYLSCAEKQLKVQIMNTQRQPNDHDYVIFAIGFAAAMLHGDDPCRLQWDLMSTQMCRHILCGLSAKDLHPFPSSTVYCGPAVRQETVLKHVVLVLSAGRGVDLGV